MQSVFGINVFVVLCVLLTSVRADRFPLSIIHINDLHARYESTEPGGDVCTDTTNCMGGYARTIYTVKRLLNELSATNPVYLNAGDSFQGTLWYNIGRWNVTSEMLNLLPADAMTLGNHEFEHEIEGLTPFLDTVQTEMLVANMDARNEPTIQGKYKNSTIIMKDNRKIGVIGVILQTIDRMASTGKLIFYNESQTILEEAAKLKEQGANIIIVLSHCGYDVDKIIAEQAGSVVDVIVGSHSHTFLYTGENLPGPEKPQGDYPTEVIHKSGHRVLIVQASSYARYVGNITVYFDDDGNVIDYEGAPIYMSADVPEDEYVLQHAAPWAHIVELEKSRQIGEAKKTISLKKCWESECALGNLWADALLNSVQKVFPQVNAALVVNKEIKTSINKGPITKSTLLQAAPYNDILIVVQLQGQHILNVLEEGVASLNLSDSDMDSLFLQVSGLSIKYDLSSPENHRVKEVLIRNPQQGLSNYEPLVPSKNYYIVVCRFVYSGGFGFNALKEFGVKMLSHSGDTDALETLIMERRLITNQVSGRITFV